MNIYIDIHTYNKCICLDSGRQALHLHEFRIHIFTCTCIHMHICTHTHIVYVYIHTRTYIHASLHKVSGAAPHTYKLIHMHTCVLTYISLGAARLAHTQRAAYSTHCNTLQPTATRCNTLQHTAAHCNTHSLQHTATHWMLITLLTQHTATHCNTRNILLIKHILQHAYIYLARHRASDA